MGQNGGTVRRADLDLAVAVGAAYYYAQRLKSDALVLVCDFGGGTSDFSLIRFERRGTTVSATPIGHAGVAVAGDNFDYRIIDAVVSPLLGKGTQFKSFDKIVKHYHSGYHSQLINLKREIKRAIKQNSTYSLVFLVFCWQCDPILDNRIKLYIDNILA